MPNTFDDRVSICSHRNNLCKIKHSSCIKILNVGQSITRDYLPADAPGGWLDCGYWLLEGKFALEGRSW